MDAESTVDVWDNNKISWTMRGQGQQCMIFPSVYNRPYIVRFGLQCHRRSRARSTLAHPVPSSLCPLALPKAHRGTQPQGPGERKLHYTHFAVGLVFEPELVLVFAEEGKAAVGTHELNPVGTAVEMIGKAVAVAVAVEPALPLACPTKCPSAVSAEKVNE